MNVHCLHGSGMLLILACITAATATNFGTEQMMDAMSIHFFLLNSEMTLIVLHLSDASTYVVCTYAVCKHFLNIT